MVWDPRAEQFTCWCLKCYEGKHCDNVPNRALGMENGDIRDNQITASSEYNSFHRVANGRLNFCPSSGRSCAWSSLKSNIHQWLQVDLKIITLITGIGTQGRNHFNVNQFVKRYTISSSKDGETFQFYKQEEAVKLPFYQPRVLSARLEAGASLDQ
ncbi:lactadherin-like [Dendronephthya gigantea]|nr:lactadherin-like [Dendronephthya gigantea]